MRGQEGHEKLAAQIERDTGAVVDHAELRDTLDMIGLAYDGARYWKDEDKRYPHSLGEVTPAVNRVIALLSHWPNERRLFPDAPARRRLHRLVGELETVRDEAQDAMLKDRRPRVRRDHELYDAVSELKDYWTGRLKQKFTNRWHTEGAGRLRGRRLPVSNAARFVYSAMTLIDRKRLPEIEKVMANLIGGR